MYSTTELDEMATMTQTIAQLRGQVEAERQRRIFFLRRLTVVFALAWGATAVVLAVLLTL